MLSPLSFLLFQSPDTLYAFPPVPPKKSPFRRKQRFCKILLIATAYPIKKKLPKSISQFISSVKYNISLQEQEVYKLSYEYR